MLLAAIAFVVQGASAVISQSAAATGFMPQPAEMAGGGVHFHGQVAHILHEHDGAGAGHVHNSADPRHHDLDDEAPAWSLNCTCAVIPQPAMWTVAFAIAGKVERLPQLHLAGIEPEALSRPPSTPDIG